MVAGQKIHVGNSHAGLTVDVHPADTTWRVSDNDQLLAEVPRTTSKLIARFKVRKPEPLLAGARIVQMADAPMVSATRGLVAGASVLHWAFGTWLIPPLVAAGVWRHVVHRIPLRYEAPLWSIVFPLGMYGVGSDQLGQTDHLPAVEAIGVGEGRVALTAWTVTFVAMLAHLARSLARKPAPPPTGSANTQVPGTA